LCFYAHTLSAGEHMTDPSHSSHYQFTVNYHNDAFTIEGVQLKASHFSDEDDTKFPSAASLIGTRLSDYICDRETRQFTNLLLKTTFDRKEIRTLSYRCDTPSRKRFWRMQMSPKDNVRLVVDHELIDEQPLPATITFKFDTGRERAVRCSFCNRVRPDGIWLEPDVAFARGLLCAESENLVNYAICASCRIQALLPDA
jgi:hypothetical protein